MEPFTALKNWRSITTEREDAWVETHDDLRGLNNAVLWSSESSGRRQLELIDSPKQSRKQLTSQSETVKGVVCAHEVRGEEVISASPEAVGDGLEGRTILHPQRLVGAEFKAR